MDFAFRFAANNSSNSNTSIETAGSLASGPQTETIGSLAFVSDNCGGFDSFGSKDVFGSIDFSNMGNVQLNSSASFENASSNGVSSPSFSASDFGSSASSAASVGGESASASCGSSGGSSFSSFC